MFFIISQDGINYLLDKTSEESNKNHIFKFGLKL